MLSMCFTGVSLIVFLHFCFSSHVSFAFFAGLLVVAKVIDWKDSSPKLTCNV